MSRGRASPRPGVDSTPGLEALFAPIPGGIFRPLAFARQAGKKCARRSPTSSATSASTTPATVTSRRREHGRARMRWSAKPTASRRTSSCRSTCSRPGSKWVGASGCRGSRKCAKCAMTSRGGASGAPGSPVTSGDALHRGRHRGDGGRGAARSNLGRRAVCAARARQRAPSPSAVTGLDQLLGVPAPPQPGRCTACGRAIAVAFHTGPAPIRCQICQVAGWPARISPSGEGEQVCPERWQPLR